MRVNFCIFGNQVFSTLSNRPLEPSRDCSAAAVAKSAELFKQMFSFFMCKLHEIAVELSLLRKETRRSWVQTPEYYLLYDYLR